MKDSFGRTIDYLRISLTDRCNLRCVYCIPEGVSLCRHEELLSFEEIERLVKIFAELGIKKVRLTGGELFLRRNIMELVKKIGKIEGISELSVTTNGVLLSENIDELKSAGVKNINISIDSLDEDNYERICGSKSLAKVLKGLDEAYNAGFNVKINCVPIKSLNEKDAVKIALLSKDRKIDVRFIELMPIGAGKQFSGVSGEEIKKKLEEAYGIPMALNDDHSVAEYYHFEKFLGRIGFINPLSHSFCGNCRRIRLSSTGFLKLCLAFPDGIDLREMLRNGKQDEYIKEKIVSAVMKKPAFHSFNNNDNRGETKTMNAIGG